MNILEKEWLKLNKLTKKKFIELYKNTKLTLTSDFTLWNINFIIKTDDQVTYKLTKNFKTLNSTRKEITNKINENIALLKSIGSWINDEEFIESAGEIEFMIYRFFKEKQIFIPDEKLMEQYYRIEDESLAISGSLLTANEVLYLDKVIGIGKSYILNEFDDWSSIYFKDGYIDIFHGLYDGLENIKLEDIMDMKKFINKHKKKYKIYLTDLKVEDDYINQKDFIYSYLASIEDSKEYIKLINTIGKYVVDKFIGKYYIWNDFLIAKNVEIGIV